MPPNSKLALLLIFSVVLQGCYTSTNISTTNIEIIIPGEYKLPSGYKNVAVRYNNANVSRNPGFSNYYVDSNKFSDTTNLDSIASEIYLQNCINHLKYQQFFDTVMELEPKNYTDIKLNDSLIKAQLKMFNQADSVERITINTEVVNFSKMASFLSPDNPGKPKSIFIDPEFCLYSANDIRQIADSTGADLFLSFDFFASQDGIFSTHFKPNKSDTSGFFVNDFNIYRDATEVVHILSGWNFYDLKKQKLIYSHLKADTIKWIEPVYNVIIAKRILPSRRDAVLNAADIAGNQFAEFLVPHWLEVERMYYKFGQGDLKSANSLVKQNLWMEAAAIYRKNTKMRNNKTASKCMFNMALVCELNGDIEAAVDWVAKSMNANHKDPYHKGNCENYSRILSQRKLDIQKIEDLQQN